MVAVGKVTLPASALTGGQAGHVDVPLDLGLRRAGETRLSDLTDAIKDWSALLHSTFD